MCYTRIRERKTWGFDLAVFGWAVMAVRTRFDERTASVMAVACGHTSAAYTVRTIAGKDRTALQACSGEANLGRVLRDIQTAPTEPVQAKDRNGRRQIAAVTSQP